MDWSAATNNPTFTTALGFTTLKLYGSLMLTSNMSWNLGTQKIDFESSGVGNLISTTGNVLDNLYFNGIGGEWNIVDELNVTSVVVNKGSFISNGFTLNCSNAFISNSSSVRSVYLDTSTINCGAWTIQNDNNLTMDADSALIVCNGWFYGGSSQTYFNIICYDQIISTQFCTFNSVTFPTYAFIISSSNNTFLNDVLFQGGGIISSSDNNSFDNVLFQGIAQLSSNNNTFVKAEFTGNTQILGNNSFDTLFFNNPGSTVTLQGGSTQIVSGALLVGAQSAFPIAFESSIFGIQATLLKTTDSVCWNYVQMIDMIASGGALFYAGDLSADVSNNTGWIFDKCNIPTSILKENITNLNVIVFPNPNQGIFNINIESENSQELNLIVRNVIGMNVYSKSLNYSQATTSHTVDLSFLPKGIYFLDMILDDQELYRKLIIE